jgi:NodT family efflux transporter outer membrane factor (OMF) lipoprotein
MTPRRCLELASCAVATAMAVACATSKPYEPPAIQAPEAFRENQSWKAAEPRDANARGAWWELFGDDDLNALERRVDVSNQTLKAAAAAFAQARAIVRGTRSNLYPQVAATASVSTVRTSGTRAVSPFHSAYGDYVAAGDVTYDVDVWGRLRGIVESSRTSAQATAADLETARLSLHAELAADYFMLRGLDRERDLLNRAVEAYTQALELTQNRFSGGLASQADVAQAETQLETTRAQAVDIEVFRAAVEHAIAVIIGEPATTWSLPATSVAAAPPDVPIGVPSDLLERRADIAAAERRIASATADVGVATSALYPLLTLSGAAGFETSSFGRWFAGASNFWTAGPAAVVNVFDAGRRRAAREQAVARLDEVSAVYHQTLLTAFREVEDQLAALRVLDEESRIQDRAVDASERSLTLATNRYRGGVTSYLEVITAQSAALANQRAAVNVLTRRMTATVLLLKGLGGDWRVASLPAVTK